MPSAPPNLRRLVWAYFWLLLFEGALRKWLVPGLSTALLLIRDPVVVAIYLLALQRGLFPASFFLMATGLLAFFCFVASFAGVGTLPITIYGLHADFLHLPLIFLMPRILRTEDVLAMAKALVYTLPPMTLLAVLQFKGGPDSHWNVGAGGEIGAQLYAAQGKVRASGTFSFATGFAAYLSLCCTVILDSLLARRAYARWGTYLGLPCLVLSLVVSGSRTAVLSVGIVCMMAVLISLINPRRFGAALRPLILTIAAAIGIAAVTPLFREGLAVHHERFAGSGGLKEGIIYRYGEDFAAAGRAFAGAPLLGFGLGVGTNVGAQLISGGRDFLLGEGEWERVIMESGPLLGSAYIALRCGVLLVIIAAAVRALRYDQVLPLLILAVTGIDLFTGPFGQPTALGFTVFTAGLALAAANPPTAPRAPSGAPPNAPPTHAIQGRSAYAQRLHGSSTPTLPPAA